ncbi:ribokinase [Strigomonas culicis]|uniref:Ribokinase n=1 Tax=Strigomonas culicis TaxID=28005 RepID=S9VJI5_9TRYP|nr:ribokinase [Strigomonas culicis]EPY33196.1 ribokinase [Strigomonas culicis]|eukprot:EPY27216.1 ribokinase [Strigomonas culicis]
MNRVQTLKSQTGDFAPVVVVLGSCFVDYVAYVDHAPQLGETMHSQNFQKGFGGKGGNQAVAAGRLGAKVAMVGMVGGDGDGADYIKQLQTNGVNTDYMFRDSANSTGLAMIFVETKGSNEIVISPNATKTFTEAFVREHTGGFEAILPKSVRFVVCQHEIPLATTLATLKEAHQRGIYTIFNSAPAPTPAEVAVIKPYLTSVSLFCPNEVEAQLMTGITIADSASATKAVKALQAMGVRDVVITLGAAGFVLSENGAEPTAEQAKRVKAVDTTGAGDCFVGSMTYFLSRGHGLLESCRRANACAAVSVTRKGTQASYPKPSELPPGIM